jgi:Pentapeptide repeats (8 copies)
MSGFLEVYPPLLIIAVTALAALVIFIGILPIIFGSLYKRRYGLAGEKLAELEAETRSTMGQVAVGLAGFVVLWTAVESIKSTNQTLELSSQNLALSKSTQIAERFSNAVDLLNQENDSSTSKSVVDGGSVARVGGVFALDRIVESDPAYLEPTLHVLAAMVQRESPRGLPGKSGGVQQIAGFSEDYLKAGRQEPTVGAGSTEDNYRFRPCDWLDAHPGISPYTPGSDHETLAPDIAAALTVIGQLGTVRSSEVSDQYGGTPMTRNIDLSRAKLCIAYVKGGKLAGAWLRNSDLRGAILDEANLTNAGLVAVDLTGAHLASANLVNSSLREATLNQADLSSADLSGADLSGADLWRAKLDDANLSGANLQTVKNLTQDQLDQACGSSRTKLPNGLITVDCSNKTNSMWPSSFHRVEAPLAIYKQLIRGRA